MRASRIAMLAASLTLVVSHGARAQESWLPADDAPTDALLVGHAALSDSIAVDGGFVTLGSDGLVVRWSADAAVMAWSEVVGARSLVAASDSVFAVGPATFSELDRHTLAERSSFDLIDWVDCADGSMFAWTDDEAVRVSSAGMTRGHAHSVPFDIASCVVIGDRAWLGWFDGAAVHVLGDDLTTSGELAWDLETDPRFGALGPGPAAIAPIPGQPPTSYALTEVAAPDGVTGELDECGRFTADGTPAGCGASAPFDPRWLVTIPPRPVAAALLPDAVVLVEPYGYAVVSLVDGVPGVQTVQSPGARVIAVVGDPEQTHLVSCEDTAAGAALLAIDPIGGGIAASDLLTGVCPTDAFARGESVSLAVGGSRVDYAVETGFLVGESARISAATPPAGRSRLAFALVGDFMASCQEDAVTLTRTREAADGEPIFGPICARDARLVPVDGTDNTAIGVGLVSQSRGRWSAVVIAPDGTEIWRGQIGAAGATATSLRYDGDTAWLVDPATNSTANSDGTETFEVMPALLDADVRIWSDPRRTWVEAGGERVAFRIERGSLLVESPRGVWADDELLGRVVVRGPDGAPHVLTADQRTTDPLVALLAAALPTNADSDPVDEGGEAPRLRPLQRLVDPNRRLILGGRPDSFEGDGSGEGASEE